MNHLLLRIEMSQLALSETFNKMEKLCGILLKIWEPRSSLSFGSSLSDSQHFKVGGIPNQIKAVRHLIYPSLPKTPQQGNNWLFCVRVCVCVPLTECDGCEEGKEEK